MKLGYDPVGNKEYRLAKLTINFYTEDCSDTELDNRADQVEDVIGDIEETIRTFTMLPNHIRLITET